MKRVRDNDVALHEGNQVFSCGSLAPKLKSGRHKLGKAGEGEGKSGDGSGSGEEEGSGDGRKARSGHVGCMGGGFTRDKQKWEMTDGAVYVFKRLVSRRDTYSSTVHCIKV